MENSSIVGGKKKIEKVETTLRNLNRIPRRPLNGCHMTSLEKVSRKVLFHQGKLFIISGNLMKNDTTVWNTSSRITPKDIKKVWIRLLQCARIHKWKSIREVLFQLQGCSQANDKCLQLCAFYLKQLPKLQRVTLHILNNSNNINKSFVIFGSTFGRGMPDLKKLRIAYREYPDHFLSSRGLNPEAFEDFGYELSRCPLKLQKLSLHFKSCSDIKDQCVSALGYNIGRYMRQLKTLELSFPECKLTNKGLKSIGFRTKRYTPKLEALKFTFGGDDIKEQGIVDTLDLLAKNCSSLKTLSINIFKYDFKGQGVAAAIGGLSTLKELHLFVCKEYGINSGRLSEIVLEILKYPIVLDKLILQLPKHGEGTFRKQMGRQLSFIPTVVFST